MAAGVTDELKSVGHLCKLIDDANPPKKRACGREGGRMTDCQLETVKKVPLNRLFGCGAKLPKNLATQSLRMGLSITSQSQKAREADAQERHERAARSHGDSGKMGRRKREYRRHTYEIQDHRHDSGNNYGSVRHGNTPDCTAHPNPELEICQPSQTSN